MSKKQSAVSSKWIRILIPLMLIIAWLGVAGMGGPYFGRIDEVSEIDLAAFLPESAESTKVNQAIEKYRDTSSIPAVIVFEATDTGIGQTDKQAIEASVASVPDISGVTDDTPTVVVADDNQAALVTTAVSDSSNIGDVLNDIKADVTSDNLPSTNLFITGPAGFSSDLNKAFAGIDTLLLGVALGVVFLILLAVYRSPLLPILVLLTALFALAASILIVWQLAAHNIVQLNGQVQGILFILVIGAATDYSLLYVARFREELKRHQQTWVAARAAIKASFEPIIASGGTVIVGLLCLLFSDLASNQALGPVGAIGIALAMAAALSFLPAVLLVFGRASFWPLRPLYDPSPAATDTTKPRLWQRIGNLVAAYPRRVWVLTTVALLVACAGIFQLQAKGVAQSELIVGYSEARQGQQVVSDHFPGGAGSPAAVLAPQDNMAELVTLFDADTGVASVSVAATNSPSGAKPLGESAADIKTDIRQQIESDVNADSARYQAAVDRGLAPSVDELVAQAYPFSDAEPNIIDNQVLLQVTLQDAPDSEAAKATIERLRQKADSIDSSIAIGGPTAVQLDTNQASINDRQLIIPLVLAAITIILMLLLRAVIAPLLLLATTVISFGATLGIAALLFNYVWDFPGADPSVVLYAFVFLVALGIDYNIFLMTRVREETIKIGTRAGVIKGLVVTGGVITSAGVVLAATFAALAVIPILFLAQLAFIVAFGVLLDTMIVRSLLVPALIRDSGSIVWWPSKLRRKK